MKFRSKFDKWIVVTMIVAGLAIIWAAVGLISRGLIVPGVMTVCFVIVIAASVFPTYYECLPERLVIHSGWVRWSIPYSQIIDVKPSDSLRSSPALSTDRYEVCYSKGKRVRTVLISPEDADKFIEELKSRRN